MGKMAHRNFSSLFVTRKNEQAQKNFNWAKMGQQQKIAHEKWSR